MTLSYPLLSAHIVHALLNSPGPLLCLGVGSELGVSYNRLTWLGPRHLPRRGPFVTMSYGTGLALSLVPSISRIGRPAPGLYLP